MVTEPAGDGWSAEALILQRLRGIKLELEQLDLSCSPTTRCSLLEPHLEALADSPTPLDHPHTMLSTCHSFAESPASTYTSFADLYASQESRDALKMFLDSSDEVSRPCIMFSSSSADPLLHSPRSGVHL